MSELVNIDKLQAAAAIVRAGSDYIPCAWTISIAAEIAVDFVTPTVFERDDGSTFRVYAVREEVLGGRDTILFTDEDGAMLLGVD